MPPLEPTPDDRPDPSGQDGSPVDPEPSTAAPAPPRPTAPGTSRAPVPAATPAAIPDNAAHRLRPLDGRHDPAPHGEHPSGPRTDAAPSSGGATGPVGWYRLSDGPPPDNDGLPFELSPPTAAERAQHPTALGTSMLPPVRDPDRADDPELPTRDRLLLALLGARALTLDFSRRARLSGWLWPLAVTLLAGVLRFWRLGVPHELVFDETYYVKQGFSLLHQGYEGTWAEGADDAFALGDASGLSTTAEYVVHPPVGKWLIGLGIHLGGGIGSSFAWRLSSAILGTLAVLMVARIGRRLFASTLLGTLAGLFMALDGEAIVHSRTALLDNTVMFFALAAFGALLLDRDQTRRRLAARTAQILDSGGDLRWGPSLGWRWWRLAAAVLLGLCIGTKWSGLYFLAVLGVLTVCWDAAARRTVGVRRWAVAALVKDAIPAGFVMVLTAAVTYLGTWASWFLHPGSYLRQWAVEHPGEGVSWLPAPLRSLWHFHTQMWEFHNTLDSPHTYQAHPLGWIVQWRPTSFYYPRSIADLRDGGAEAACGATSCSQAITSIGNPVIWWCGALALVVAVIWLIRHRDWRAGAALSGIAAGWLPWFGYAHRTIFTFYSIAFTPWVILTLVFALGLLLRSPDPDQRHRGTVVTTALVTVVVAVSAFYYPIWTAWVVPYDFWHLHMWLRSWV